MKAKVRAVIRNSPIFPVTKVTAEKEFEFDEDDNVFSRLVKVRQYFYKTYRVSRFMDVEIVEVTWL